MGILETGKAELRSAMRAMLLRVGREQRTEWDAQICERAMESGLLRDAEWVYAYAPLGWEPGIWNILEQVLDEGGKLALPRTGPKDGEMSFVQVSSLAELKKGRFGILEPGTEAEPLPAPVPGARITVLTPGLAFAPDGRRLGKGGGYYDRFFAVRPGVTSVGIAYEWQIRDDVLEGEQDMRVAWIVTPDRVIQTGLQSRP
ncbi:MAG: 5-formyltetrahydrofolate cyclo-ligase [Lachnospiraceae bacterium]|nr:5-formyltetrahydrofolate cyclo-ligase [Lachnospiraceae bacterium]